MKTIKLQATTTNLQKLLDIMKSYSSAFRFAYNRTIENKTEKEIRPLLKTKFNIGSWLQQCAIKEAIATKKALDERNQPYNVIFGSKDNFMDRLQNKISKEQYKLNRWDGRGL